MAELFQVCAIAAIQKHAVCREDQNGGLAEHTKQLFCCTVSATLEGLSQQLTVLACRAQDTLFGAPCLMRHTIDAQVSKGFSNITAVYATPTTPGRCRAIIRNLFKFKSPVPRFFFSKQCCHTADVKAVSLCP